MIGTQSIRFLHPPYLISGSSIVGDKEGDGPLGEYFDVVEQDPMCGASTWEEAESKFQQRAAELAIEKAGLKNQDIRYIVAGDLLGQMIATSFGISSLQIPLFGVYGACSTMGESMAIAAMLVEGGYAKHVLALTSSHFASAERQFRFPSSYGNQRPFASTWTVTGSGAVVLAAEDALSEESKKNGIRVREITTGKITDYGIKDSMNMGACMAPGACDVIYSHLKDNEREPSYYDRIVTGDLGVIGKKILIEMLQAKGYDISKNHMDCGMAIYASDEQKTQAGGSGCGCAAVTLTAYIVKKLQSGEWSRVLFVPTGALLSQISFNEGNTVPGIAHGVVLERDADTQNGGDRA